MTPDYNDGEWHGWSGKREMPVHPDSVIEVVWHDPRGETAGISRQTCGVTAWGHVLKFRVISPYIEPPKPREFWAYGGRLYSCRIGAASDRRGNESCGTFLENDDIIHLREVLE
jgi:hypothetical protein